MKKRGFTRRDFLKAAGAGAAWAAVGTFPTELFAEGPRLVQFPQKDPLILLTARPPQLETPLEYFRRPVTPNSAVFVRWHLADIPTSVDPAQWRLKVGGNTERQLQLSMADLREFEKVGYTAVIQCSGNGRSFFEPRVFGGQWKHGAMGNVTWSGARLKDILMKAGLKQGSVEVSFDGLDKGSLPTVHDFVKSLPVDKAMEEDIIVAYEMNGQPLPMLNGFPARLIVPGWYATYWVKALSEINVLTSEFTGFWMKSAYRQPDNSCGCVPPGTAPSRTVPVNRMTTRSLIITPTEGSTVRSRATVEVMGIAFSGGYSIKDVIVSADGGRTWGQAQLGKDQGRYAWIQWTYAWKPEKPGDYVLMAKSTNSVGESQPLEGLWNPPGYLLNRVEKHPVKVS